MDHDGSPNRDPLRRPVRRAAATLCAGAHSFQGVEWMGIDLAAWLNAQTRKL